MQVAQCINYQESICPYISSTHMCLPPLLSRSLLILFYLAAAPFLTPYLVPFNCFVTCSYCPWLHVLILYKLHPYFCPSASSHPLALPRPPTPSPPARPQPPPLFVFFLFLFLATRSLSRSCSLVCRCINASLRANAFCLADASLLANDCFLVANSCYTYFSHARFSSHCGREEWGGADVACPWLLFPPLFVLACLFSAFTPFSKTVYTRRMEDLQGRKFSGFLLESVL